MYQVAVHPMLESAAEIKLYQTGGKVTLKLLGATETSNLSVQMEGVSATNTLVGDQLTMEFPSLSSISAKSVYIGG